MTDLPPDLVADLFRHRFARLVAGLCRVLGPGNLDLAEDVVQEAMLRALRSWPVDGVPDQPEAWLCRVARNLALDSLRRQRIGRRVEQELAAWATADDSTAGPEPDSIADDTLRMLFLASHPAVPADARVPLLLKTVCGFGVPAIARALLQKDATIAQRLVRAKAKLQSGDVTFAMPDAAEMPARLDLVLQVIYLVFNEGYRAHAGDTLLRCDLVDEAVRLTALLLEMPATARPEVHALLALELLLGARSPARTDSDGNLVPLAQQDRARWDRRWLSSGFVHFERSIGGDRLTPYHVEAAIACAHASAPDYATTDWPRILGHYDQLLALAPSPIVRLNRAVAVGKVHGPLAARTELDALAAERALDGYFLLFAVRAQMHWALGEHAAAAAALERAQALPCTEPEQRLLAARLAAVRRGEPPPAW